jgi:phospholipid/cholesterol/gamma-HCH transport system substrate-binding protein
MNKYSKEEVKVGAFVLAGTAALLFILFMMGAFRSTAGTYPVRILYNYISGLEKGAPVRFAGAEVGKVERVEVLNSSEKSNVAVIVSVREGVELRKDSTAYIDTLGLMGEKYVEITPGTEDSHVLGKNEALVGQDPVAINTLYQKGIEIADKVDKNLVLMESLL